MTGSFNIVQSGKTLLKLFLFLKSDKVITAYGRSNGRQCVIITDVSSSSIDRHINSRLRIESRVTCCYKWRLDTVARFVRMKSTFTVGATGKNSGIFWSQPQGVVDHLEVVVRPNRDRQCACHSFNHVVFTSHVRKTAGLPSLVISR